MANAEMPKIGNPEEPQSGGERELLQALKDELAEERSRKESIERRGLTIAAAAATSTALLFGLGSRYTGLAEDVFFVVLLLGGAAFLASAIAGWKTAWLEEYSEINVKELDDILEEGWPEDERELLRFLAAGVYDTITDSRRRTNGKAVALRWSLNFLVIGAGLVLVELSFVVVDRLFG